MQFIFRLCVPNIHNPKAEVVDTTDLLETAATTTTTNQNTVQKLILCIFVYFRAQRIWER